MSDRALLMVMLLVGATLFATAATAEDGTLPGTCDPSGQIVCALAGAGARVTCEPVEATGFMAGCVVTHGWAWQAFSRAGVPGHADGLSEGEIEVCRAGQCETAELQTGSFSCDWIGVTTCSGEGDDTISVPGFVLSPGECFRITIQQRTSTVASALGLGEPLASAEWHESSSAGRAGCFLDNGR